MTDFLLYRKPPERMTREDLESTVRKLRARHAVNAAIVKVILPQSLRCIDDLLDVSQEAPTALVVCARRLLPSTYRHTFTKAKT